MLTDDHRVATHKLERRRLEQKGSTIAPVDLNGADAHDERNYTINPEGMHRVSTCTSLGSSSLDGHVHTRILCSAWLSAA